MSLVGNLRRAVSYALYTPPDPIDGEGGLSTHGIVDIVLASPEKRDVVRYMAYHMGTRRRYSPDRGGSYALNVLSDRVVRGDSLDVSTDPTDYDELDEYHDTVRDARLTYLRESVIPDLLNAKVLEVTTGTNDWVSCTDDVTDEITGIRPGPRFEPAVQALRWIDSNGTQYDWEDF